MDKKQIDKEDFIKQLENSDVVKKLVDMNLCTIEQINTRAEYVATKMKEFMDDVQIDSGLLKKLEGTDCPVNAEQIGHVIMMTLDSLMTHQKVAGPIAEYLAGQALLLAVFDNLKDLSEITEAIK